MLLIGFGNKARQGKDTAADAIEQFYNQRNDVWRGLTTSKTPYQVVVKRFKFATALYDEVNDFLRSPAGEAWVVGHGCHIGEDFTTIPGWVRPDPNPEVSTLAPFGKHPKLLQWWGTEYRRNEDPEYWTKKLFASIPANLSVAMVTDVRFPNEADGIKQRGGFVVNVQRLHEDSTSFFSGDRPVDHPSEVALDGYNFDYYIKTKSAVLTGDFAVTLVEYLRGLNAK
jgi:hypothetical protein